MIRPRNARRFLAAEVVQTSAMDCGPAALKCLLEGFGIPVSYGRLREACQTDVDGTSIDTIEVVANELGVVAEQHMVPVDYVLAAGARLPILIVVRHADGATHFVVVWRRSGPWLQVMDPAVGRRWVREQAFLAEIFRHEMSVPAADWRVWAGSEDFLRPLRAALARMGASRRAISELTSTATADAGWFTFGALDASARLVAEIVNAGGVRAGPDSLRLLRALFRQTLDNTRDIFRLIPTDYWSVRPDPNSPNAEEQRLLVRGAVLLRVSGRTPRAQHALERDDAAPLSPELVAALGEKTPTVLASLWALLKEDGLLAPTFLFGAVCIAAAATLIEALLFRGIFDLGALLNVGSQRLLAALGLLGFMSLVLAFQLPIVSESLRLGRRLDTRFRMALLAKLPRLADRYFQSRPVSDMADRGHSIHMTRGLPGMGVQFVQALCNLALTLAGIALLDPLSSTIAGAIVAAAIVAPAAFQPLINERDLRVRNHLGALSSFYLDALLGLVPIRVHRAERVVRRRHESLLVEWVRSSRRFIRASTLVDGVQNLICLSLTAALLLQHFLRAQGVTGADLLLVYWSLKLPAAGRTVSSLAHRYPQQRNVLLRLMEPLSAPEPIGSPSRQEQATGEAMTSHPARPADATSERSGMSIRIESGSVLAAGHPILHDLDLSIAPGEHVAIVGPSGAGKSSLIGLLLGWHRLATGQLLIDGSELDAQGQETLRRTTAWVDPAVQIWNQSLLSNLTYSAPDAGLGRTGNAIDAAALRGVLQKLPQGLQTPLGEGGALLSGGEGQRVRLARALAQTNVRLALLDEPFRGMDRSQRAMLLAEARRRWRDITLLCVTHDVSETMAFDRVLVIEDGAVREDDCPARLAARPSRYRELLDAERFVRDRMWKGKQWRHIRIENGTVVESGEAEAELSAPAPSLVYPKLAGGQPS